MSGKRKKHIRTYYLFSGHLVMVISRRAMQIKSLRSFSNKCLSAADFEKRVTESHSGKFTVKPCVPPTPWNSGLAVYPSWRTGGEMEKVLTCKSTHRNTFNGSHHLLMQYTSDPNPAVPKHTTFTFFRFCTSSFVCRGAFSEWKQSVITENTVQSEMS